MVVNLPCGVSTNNKPMQQRDRQGARILNAIAQSMANGWMQRGPH